MWINIMFSLGLSIEYLHAATYDLIGSTYYVLYIASKTYDINKTEAFLVKLTTKPNER